MLDVLKLARPPEKGPIACPCVSTNSGLTATTIPRLVLGSLEASLMLPAPDPGVQPTL